jgi:hypothetical protein
MGLLSHPGEWMSDEILGAWEREHGGRVASNGTIAGIQTAVRVGGRRKCGGEVRRAKNRNGAEMGGGKSMSTGALEEMPIDD